MKKPFNVPKFKSEDEERDFWSKTDLSKHLEPEDLIAVSFPNLKPSSHSISIRIPEYLLLRIKERANELHVPYQSLIKKYIAQGVLRKE
jgi:predicted DNA binding CopG/RHH family protein